MSARRGESLRAHILWTAKQVFLESGFERASMDDVAARAQTSKRTLYAFFGSKEKLFLAVIDLVRELYIEQLGTPGDRGETPAEAVALFLIRVHDHVLWESVIRTCRLAVAEAERLPEAARGYFDIIVGLPQARIADYLTEEAEMSADVADRVARDLLGATLHPSLLRALYAVEAPLEHLPEDHPAVRAPGAEARLSLAAARAIVDAALAPQPPWSGVSTG